MVKEVQLGRKKKTGKTEEEEFGCGEGHAGMRVRRSV